MQLKTFRGATVGLGLMLAAGLAEAQAQGLAQETGSLPPAPLAAVGDQPSAPVPSVAEPEGGALRLASPAPGTFAALIVSRLTVEPASLTEPEQKERQALAELYAGREGKPLWLDREGALNEQARSAKAALLAAGDWGLQAADFTLPKSLDTGSAFATAEARADAELALSLAVLKYARHARGGRILDPTTSLSSYLDRKPQLIEPKAVLERLASAEDAGAAMTAFHPRHIEFERLRHAYLATRGPAGQKGQQRSDHAEAKRLLANMEEWRWMPADMGDLYVQVNIPEFLLRVYKNGEVIHTEKIVAGEIGKQTPIFSRPLKKIVFRPKWRVPESIKVRELWPSMLKGGGQMTAFGLQLETKDGQPLDWRKIDWTKSDIRQYEVVQPPGPKSVLGLVKFAFPSQHTVYMHDTQDKYMFAASQRTFSHGCMRVRNPLLYAEVLLREDKGWDGARIRELASSGPLDNQVEITRRLPIHITYFTARSGEGGRIEIFRDVYGHERRITQALEGKWAQIAKGRDHLAPVELDLAAGVTRATRNGARVADSSKGGPKPAATIMDALFGGGF